jgi:hypothetical protein
VQVCDGVMTFTAVGSGACRYGTCRAGAGGLHIHIAAGRAVFPAGNFPRSLGSSPKCGKEVTNTQHKAFLIYIYSEGPGIESLLSVLQGIY